MEFRPDYRNMLAVLENRKPPRLPVYEHIISEKIMEQVLGAEFADLEESDGADLEHYFTQYCRFWQEMTYDTVSYEYCITRILPGPGAIRGGRGPLQTRQDFERYPWGELADRYWQAAERKFDMLRRCLPPGMKALGGVGNGVFEISEDLVGYEYLAYLHADDPDLYVDLYQHIGDLMVEIWRRFLERYGDVFAICRFGDDLGFKTATLVSPKILRTYVLPQYKRVIEMIRGAGKPFLWHSCGNIFAVMDDVIALGINAKHSNEDVIAPYERWIERYNDRIGLLGGIDVDVLCRTDPQEIFERVFELGTRYRGMAKGYALGSGNSIPDFVPLDGYLAMIRAAQEISQAGSKRIKIYSQGIISINRGGVLKIARSAIFNTPIPLFLR